MLALGTAVYTDGTSRCSSGCVARFLIGHGPVPVCGPGVGDPWTGLPRKISEDSALGCSKTESLEEREDADEEG